MTFLIPFIIYIFFIIGLVYLTNYIFKSKVERVRKKIRGWIIGIGVFLFFPLGFLNFIYHLSLAFEDHNNVKRGTFLWYATMDNKTITEFPTINVKGDVKYNKRGGDNPNIGGGWEIEYESTENTETLRSNLLDYLKSENFNLLEKSSTEFKYWKVKDQENGKLLLYFGSKKKKYSSLKTHLYLMIQELKNGRSKIKCAVIM